MLIPGRNGNREAINQFQETEGVFQILDDFFKIKLVLQAGIRIN